MVGFSTDTAPGPASPDRDSAFADAAGRMAGMAGAAFGWSPDAFWRATPAELGALVRAVGGDEGPVADAGDLERLMRAFPDG
jgi:uncharacterized phage protein (TIGR02216 family)